MLIVLSGFKPKKEVQIMLNHTLRLIVYILKKDMLALIIYLIEN